jgi:serine/threonine protein kinase/tetratricopeptide (TPR) repeat protein
VLDATHRLGPYQIVAPLGAGGMGEVYRARDTRLARDVAVKVLPEAFADHPTRQARFEREARAVAALSHPNILAIHDFGTEGSVTYAVMELLEGETLSSRLARGPMPWPEAVTIGTAIANGLAAAHEKGIVHRDIKPDNLFLTADGRVKILDFGLAQIDLPSETQTETGAYVPPVTEAGTLMGTVGYMSPEQVRGETVDARSDLFSFGCVLYEMVTGQRAFRRKSAAETMTAILHDDPPTAMTKAIPASLARLIRHCLVKNAEQRLPSARELIRQLQSIPLNARPPRPSRRVVVLAVTLLLTLIAMTSLYVLYGRGKPNPTPPEPALSLEALAVLPFENVGGDAKTESLSDGLSDHLIHALSQVRRQNLKIRPFTSSARYKHQRPDAPTLGRELNVQLIVTGTLQQQGNDLSVSVAIIDLRDDNQIWGKRYRDTHDKILDLQDQIAKDVAENLGLKLTGDERQRLTKRHTENSEAYRLYCEALYHFNKFTPDGLTTAMEYAERALKQDPNYALAYTALARCYALQGSLFVGPRVSHPEARKHFSQALALDPTLDDAYAGLAIVSMFLDWDWQAADRALTRAEALNPDLPYTYTTRCFYLAALGRVDESLASARRGQENDPQAAPRQNELAQCYNWLRQYDRAIVAADRALALDPRFLLAYGEKGIALLKNGKPQDAVTILQKGLTYGPNPKLRGLLGCAYAAAGQRSEAEQMLKSLRMSPMRRFGEALAIARIHAALGETDSAFEWLRNACEERDSGVIWIKVDPTLDPLRNDPRFAAIVKEMGLPP